MPHHAELPPEERFEAHPGPANDPSVTNLPAPEPDFGDEPSPVRAPLRFGRLALWMASASALGIGVLGTVGYGMWFNHDQRVYAEAMASARKTLSIEQPVIAAQTQSAGVVEAPGTAPAVYVGNTSGDTSADVTATPLDTASPSMDAPTTVAADDDHGRDAAGTAELATATALAATPQTSVPAQTAAATRRGNGPAVQTSNRAVPSAQANPARRHSAHAKPEGGLIARVGAFFHRVSYRHNVPTRQREEYSRP
ncbi:hypothetical protein QCE63_08670 [Caballeronia sp. LZ065]|uniref:hypothetical protein n=1 Tax=Caballeronia sp. LZ065 TaxID=3038571 RepID=UPI002862A78D|nr:hypothetical protein [Caballeronia sp. LZ065]MDR5779500.1 hypothetical protein [Caballeronia sp. LZ065]